MNSKEDFYNFSHIYFSATDCGLNELNDVQDIIIEKAVSKIVDGDVILVFSNSYVIGQVLKTAKREVRACRTEVSLFFSFGTSLPSRRLIG